MADIPSEVLKAARLLADWADQNGFDTFTWKVQTEEPRIVEVRPAAGLHEQALRQAHEAGRQDAFARCSVLMDAMAGLTETDIAEAIRALAKEGREG